MPGRAASSILDLAAPSPPPLESTGSLGPVHQRRDRPFQLECWTFDFHAAARHSEADEAFKTLRVIRRHDYPDAPLVVIEPAYRFA